MKRRRASLYNLADFRPPTGALNSTSGAGAQIVKFPAACCRQFAQLKEGDTVFHHICFPNGVEIRRVYLCGEHVDLVIGEYLYKAHHAFTLTTEKACIPQRTHARPVAPPTSDEKEGQP